MFSTFFDLSDLTVHQLTLTFLFLAHFDWDRSDRSKPLTFHLFDLDFAYFLHFDLDLSFPDRPSAPRNLTVTSASGEHVSLQWEHSESDGGAPITGYVIEKRDADRSNWSRVGTATSDRTSYRAGKLFEGTSYVFRVSGGEQRRPE